MSSSKSLPYPQTPQNRPVSEIPTDSSVYSQPSPETHNLQMPRLEIPRSSSVYPDDVSPVESSEGFQSRAIKSSPNVSPITDPQSAPADLDTGKHDSPTGAPKRSQMFGGAGTLFSRKIRPSALSTPNRESSSTTLTRWDDFSGERTASEKGKPASTSPDAVRLDVEAKYGRRKDSLGNSVIISGPKPTGLRKTSSNRSPWVPPGWKGAGGRHPIVNPMLDKPLPPGKFPTFPAGSHQRSASKDQESGRVTSRPSRGLESPPLTKHFSQRTESPVNRHLVRSTSPQQSVENDLPQTVTTRPSQQPTPPAESPSSGLAPEDNRSPLARNPSHEEFKEELPPIPLNVANASSPEPLVRSEQEKASDLDPVVNLQRFQQPQSRFSATTYATTAYDSPPTTPEMNQDVTMQSPASSILDRKRPVPAAGVALNAKATARKPTPSQVSTSKQAEGNVRQEKCLPKEPPEEPKISRVESLQAKLDALRRRRGNLQTVIHELTNVVQPSSIAYDIASRQEIKRTVDGLGKELSEVIKEEHETGLKLHRAYKRHDDAASEPTHLWVRRVTS